MLYFFGADKGFFRRACLIAAFLPYWCMAQTNAPESSVQRCEKTVRWSSNLAPAERNAYGVSPSQESDLAVEALKRMGCTARFVDMPWARALVELEFGRLDILPGAFMTNERQRYAHFSRPYSRSTNVLFIRKANAGKYMFQALSDIVESDIRVGVQVGVSYGQGFDDMRKNPQFESHMTQLPARENAWKMLHLGRIGGLIADDYIGKREIHDLGLRDSLQASSLVISEEASMFAMSKRSLDTDFVQRFDSALNSMMADGTYKKIRERYLACQVSVARLTCR